MRIMTHFDSNCWLHWTLRWLLKSTSKNSSTAKLICSVLYFPSVPIASYFVHFGTTRIFDLPDIQDCKHLQCGNERELPKITRSKRSSACNVTQLFIQTQNWKKTLSQWTSHCSITVSCRSVLNPKTDRYSSVWKSDQTSVEAGLNSQMLWLQVNNLAVHWNFFALSDTTI